MQKNKTRKISWKKIGDSKIVKTCDELDQKAIPLWSLPMPLQHLLKEFWFLHHVIADSIWKRKRNEEKLIKVLIICTFFIYYNLFSSERWHNATFHPFGIFRHHWLSMFTFLFTFLFTWKVLWDLNLDLNLAINLGLNWI